MGDGQELLPVRFIHVIVMALASQLPSNGNGRKGFCATAFVRRLMKLWQQIFETCINYLIADWLDRYTNPKDGKACKSPFGKPYSDVMQ